MTIICLYIQLFYQDSDIYTSGFVYKAKILLDNGVLLHKNKRGNIAMEDIHCSFPEGIDSFSRKKGSTVLRKLKKLLKNSPESNFRILSL